MKHKKNEDSNIAATVGGIGDTIQEGGTVFGNFRQHLAPASFKSPENQSYNEIAVTDESVFDKIFHHLTAEKLAKFDAFVEGQDGSGVGSHDVVCGLGQIKLEEPDEVGR